MHDKPKKTRRYSPYKSFLLMVLFCASPNAPKTESSEFDDTAQYPNVKVKEARHEMAFTPKDVLYLLKEPLKEDTHFTANGYANSWYIDPKEIDKDGDGSFTVTLYFKPQSYFYLGLAISITTLLLCILYLIYDWRKSRKPPKKHDAHKSMEICAFCAQASPPSS